MGMFSFREPRRIEHTYIYYDERKEKLKKIEEKARRELGMLEEETYNPERIRGKFIEGTKYLKRRKQSGSKPLSYPVAIALIVVLLILLHYLWTGQWLF